MIIEFDAATFRIRIVPEDAAEAENLKRVNEFVRAHFVQDIKNSTAVALERLAALAEVPESTLTTKRAQMAAYRAAMKRYHPDTKQQPDADKFAQVLAVAESLGLRINKERTAPTE